MIQEYADSIGYDVNVAQHAGKFMFLITNDDLDIWEEGFDFKTREEACNAAIKAFDDIVNQK